jgi:hypothetical protein
MPSDFSGCSGFALRCDVSLRRDSRASILCVSAAAARAAVAARRHALYWGRACRLAGPVAQRLEPTAHNGLVGGSSPPGPTMIYLRFCRRLAALTNETTNGWFAFGLRPIASAASEK